MNYNLMPLKYFVDVVQTRGFISAAKKNYVSETAVSAAISKLERELGHRLLHRSAGQFALTPVGEQFYPRAVKIIHAYNEIWHHPDAHPEQLLRIHFLQGVGADAATFAAQLPSTYQLAFDEEVLDSSIPRLITGSYDLLVGFELAFINNPKVLMIPFRTISFDLLFNQTEVTAADEDLQALARQSKFYLQNWQSTGISDIQTAMLQVYQRDGWDFDQVANENSFTAACLNVNFRGGFTMVPENFQVPQNCERIYRVSPQHLANQFKLVVGMNRAGSQNLERLVLHAISSSYRG